MVLMVPMDIHMILMVVILIMDGPEEEAVEDTVPVLQEGLLLQPQHNLPVNNKIVVHLQHKRQKI